MEAQRKHNLSDIKFDMTNKAGRRVRTVFCYNKVFKYDTPLWTCDPITYEELFNIIKTYFDKYVKEYEDYKIYNRPITNSIFRMIAYCPKDLRFIGAMKGKILYEMEVDNTNKKINYEYKNTKLLETDKEKINSFYVTIEVELYNEDRFFQYDGEKDPRIEDRCVICNLRKPNVLITKCFHMTSCADCHRLVPISRCPYCDRPFAGIHKVVFAISHK